MLDRTKSSRRRGHERLVQTVGSAGLGLLDVFGDGDRGCFGGRDTRHNSGRGTETGAARPAHDPRYWAYVFGVDADVTVRGDRTGIGTSVDFSKTLGGDDSTNALRIDSLYRFNERHAIGFSWYRVALGGENTILDRQIEIGGNVINANASVQSDLNVNLYRFIYNWSFYRSDKVELALSPGFYVAATKFDLTAQGNIQLPNNQPSTSTGVNEHVTLPLPSFGVLLNYNILPRLQFQTRTDFFYLKVDDYEV